jgi:hypothetical protein
MDVIPKTLHLKALCEYLRYNIIIVVIFTILDNHHHWHKITELLKIHVVLIFTNPHHVT